MGPNLGGNTRGRWRFGGVAPGVLVCRPLHRTSEGLVAFRHEVLGARALLGAPGIATSSKKLLGALGLTTRSTRS